MQPISFPTTSFDLSTESGVFSLLNSFEQIPPSPPRLAPRIVNTWNGESSKWFQVAPTVICRPYSYQAFTDASCAPMKPPEGTQKTLRNVDLWEYDQGTAKWRKEPPFKWIVVKNQKNLPENPYQDPEKWFSRELQLIATIQSISQVVKVLGNFSYVTKKNKIKTASIQKYYPKGDLLNVLRKEGLTLPQKRAIEKQLLKALSHLEHIHLIHRDIKPANILLSNNYEPVLTDFSFAVFQKKVSDLALLGSPRYLAPEYVS